jgi:hypothetical protein
MSFDVLTCVARMGTATILWTSLSVAALTNPAEFAARNYFFDDPPAGEQLIVPDNSSLAFIAKVRVGGVSWARGRHGEELYSDARYAVELELLGVVSGRVQVGDKIVAYFGENPGGVMFPHRGVTKREFFVAVSKRESGKYQGKHYLIGLQVSSAEYQQWRSELSKATR